MRRYDYVLSSLFKLVLYSVLNKISGGIVFVVLFFIGWDFAWQVKAVVIIAVCVLATVAAIKESIDLLNDKSNGVLL